MNTSPHIDSSYFTRVSFEAFKLYTPKQFDGSAPIDSVNDFVFSASYLISAVRYPHQNEIQKRRYSTAYLYCSALLTFNEYKTSSTLIDYEILCHLLEKQPDNFFDFLGDSIKASTAGLIIFCYYSMYKMDQKEPSLNKAIHITSQLYEQWGIPLTIDEIKKRWKQYKSVSHICCAMFNTRIKHNKQSGNKKTDTFGNLSVVFKPTEFWEVLAFSETLRTFAVSYHPPRVNKWSSRPILSSDETWRPSVNLKFDPVHIDCQNFFEGIKNIITERYK
jgi:hypothetical protein